MQVQSLAIPDVKLIVPRRFPDARGFFTETWSERAFAEHGMSETFTQDNFSHSIHAGTIRGLHFQSGGAAQAKLVRVTAGSAFDIAVDLRRASPTFGRYVSAVLTAAAGEELFIPVGFAHGFCTLEPATDLAYKVSWPYSPAHDGGVLWNDPDIGIDWPLGSTGPVLSDKDRELPRLSELKTLF